MEPKKNMKAMARKILFCQHSTMTIDMRHVVTSITVITARPAFGQNPSGNEVQNQAKEVISKWITKGSVSEVGTYLKHFPCVSCL